MTRFEKLGVLVASLIIYFMVVSAAAAQGPTEIELLIRDVTRIERQIEHLDSRITSLQNSFASEQLANATKHAGFDARLSYMERTFEDLRKLTYTVIGGVVVQLIVMVITLNRARNGFPKKP